MMDVFCCGLVFVESERAGRGEVRANQRRKNGHIVECRTSNIGGQQHINFNMHDIFNRPRQYRLRSEKIRGEYQYFRLPH